MKNIIIASFVCCLISAPLASEAQSLGPAAIQKLAKDFDVSADVISKFKNMTLPDLQSGLDIAKKVASQGELSMNDAASKVLGAKEGGKDWTGIAKDFDVEPPDTDKIKALIED